MTPLTASLLRNVAIFAGMLLLLLGGTWAVVNATTGHLLYENATSTARSWAQYLASNANDLEQMAGGERPSVESRMSGCALAHSPQCECHTAQCQTK